MAITVGIYGISGDGKSTSIVINPDGKYDTENYQGMLSEETIIINADRKKLPYKSTDWVEGKNVFSISSKDQIIALLNSINKGTKIKSIFIDTINGIMLDYEMLESKKLTFDKWNDLAKDIYELITICNGLREDLIIYLSGHVTLYTDVDGNESKCLVTNGRLLPVLI